MRLLFFLKKKNPVELNEEDTSDDKTLEAEASTEIEQPAYFLKSAETAMHSTEVEAKGELEQRENSDRKPPAIENPHGIIHCLLCEPLALILLVDKPRDPVTCAVVRPFVDGRLGPAGQLQDGRQAEFSECNPHRLNRNHPRAAARLWPRYPGAPRHRRLESSFREMNVPC